MVAARSRPTTRTVVTTAGTTGLGALAVPALVGEEQEHGRDEEREEHPGEGHHAEGDEDHARREEEDGAPSQPERDQRRRRTEQARPRGDGEDALDHPVVAAVALRDERAAGDTRQQEHPRRHPEDHHSCPAHGAVSYIRMIETRQRLLDATRRCVRHRGLAATTSREITAEAEANLAAITYHFGSKDQLVAEALLAGLRDWLQPGLDALAEADDPATGMLTAVQSLLATFAEHQDEAPAHLEALIHAHRSPALHDGVVALWAEVRGRLAEQIAEMRAADLLPEWIDPQPMAALLVAVATGVVLQTTVDPDGPSVDAMAAQFAGLLLTAKA